MANRTLVLTGPEMTGQGQDGDLHGLVPERQTISVAPHLTVDGDTVHVGRNWQARDGADLLMGDHVAESVPKAITLAAKFARYIWDNLNPGADDTVINDENGRVEHTVVVIDFLPGSYQGQAQFINSGNSNAEKRNMYWRDNNGTTRVMRDICFRGAGAQPEDVVFPSIDVQNATTIGRGQADNIRFENLHIENTASDGAQAGFRIGTNYLNRLEDHPSFESADVNREGVMFYQTDRAPDPARGYENSVWVNTTIDRRFYKEGGVWVDKGDWLGFVKGDTTENKYQGVWKFYDCLCTGEAGSSSGNGSGCTWSLTRCAGRATGFDLRNCRFGSAFEHCAYIAAPAGFFYAVDCTQVPWNGVTGTGNTMFQFDCRPISNSGPIGYGTMAVIRCTASDNVVDITDGGADFTFGAFDGTIYLIDCVSDGQGGGGVGGGNTSAPRGAITVFGERWVDGDQDNIAKGFAVLETTSGSDEWCHIQRLELRNYRSEMYGNVNETFNLKGVGEVYFDCSFIQSDATTGGRAQVELNNDGPDATLDYLPIIDWEWGPNHQPTPSASPPFLAGTSTETDKIYLNWRSDYGTEGNLSDAQIDAFDGSDPV